RRGNADHDVREERDRVLLQDLVLDLNPGGRLSNRRAFHGGPSWWWGGLLRLRLDRVPVRRAEAGILRRVGEERKGQVAELTQTLCTERIRRTAGDDRYGQVRDVC